MEIDISIEVGQGMVSIFNNASPLTMIVTYGGLSLAWLFGSWDNTIDSSNYRLHYRSFNSDKVK